MHQQMLEKRLQAVILFSPANISYLVGFNSRDALFLFTNKEGFYITDSRYTDEVKLAIGHSFEVIKATDSLLKTAANFIRRLRLKKVGFEERYATFWQVSCLKKEIAGKIDLVPFSGIIESARQLKSPYELKKIKRAVSITKRALETISTKILAGRTELDIAWELEGLLFNYGATGIAFPIIVASGINSSLPHHQTGRRVINKNDLVLIDVGAEYEGYKSDLTRMYFLGRIKPLVKKIVTVVKEAQQEVIRRIKPGVLISDLEQQSRNFISAQGYTDGIRHSLGHGVGLEIHEGPKIGHNQNTRLLAGMVITVEPGIYLTGRFGVRIEDMVWVSERGAQIL